MKLPKPEHAIIAGIILMIILPFFLTRVGFINFNGTGQIGDTIGGITAPISGLLGAYLVYLALKEQIKANKIITDQFNLQIENDRNKKFEQFVYDECRIIREDIMSFEFRFEHTDQNNILQTSNLKGFNAIEIILLQMALFDRGHFRSTKYLENEEERIRMILSRIRNMITMIGYSGMPGEKINELILFIIRSYFYQLYLILEDCDKHRGKEFLICLECNTPHYGISKDIYQIFDSIRREYFYHKYKFDPTHPPPPGDGFYI